MPTTPKPLDDFSALTPGTYVSGLAASGSTDVNHARAPWKRGQRVRQRDAVAVRQPHVDQQDV